MTEDTMLNHQAIAAALSAPFPVEAIHWRVGSVSGKRGMAFAYLDARDVMDRLDAVVGANRWHTRHEIFGVTYICHMGIEYTPGVITWKSNGAGATDIQGEKGGVSDSTKRAGVEHGIGRYLYRLPDTWLDVTPSGRSHKITDNASNRKKMADALGGNPHAPGVQTAAQPQTPTVASTLKEAGVAELAHSLVSGRFPDMDTDSEEFASMRWEPLKWALSKAFGFTNTNQLTIEQIPELVGKMNDWAIDDENEEAAAAADPASQQ